MTPLRQQMLDAMQLRGLAVRTQEAYTGAVAGLARYYGRSPHELNQAQVQDYLIHLIRERSLATSSVNQAGSALRFFYGTVLGLDGSAFQVPLQRTPQMLPELLSRGELARLFAAARHPRARALLMTAYGTGLRVSELCNLRIRDIDSAPDRMCIHVVLGKGARDRYVPLSADLLQVLREYWKGVQPTAARPRHWLFARGGDACDDVPPATKTAQRWYYAARDAAGIERHGGIHTLRHCYATYLLDAGIDLYSISQWLGHSQVGTTTRYLRLVRPDTPDGARTGGQHAMELLRTLPPLPMH
ncbi:site-specific integrase [soil metagenome]